MAYEHKVFGMSVRLDPKCNPNMIYLVNKKAFEAQECMNHRMNYSFDKPYRLYRRGKNRCNRCGVKI